LFLVFSTFGQFLPTLLTNALILTKEMSTTIAQFMLRKTWPKNIRMNAPMTPPDTAVARALKMKGAEMKSPTPQITEMQGFSS
jgi:hypothetical protein